MVPRSIPGAPGGRRDRRRTDPGRDPGWKGGGMRLGKGAFLWSALAALSPVAAACSEVSSSSTAAGGGAVQDNSGTTVNFSISPWDGSAANVAVADDLPQNQLGSSVG